MYKKILVALDGSKYAMFGGEIALEFSEKFKSEILAVHVYDGKIHSHRLKEMEPDLPEKYQEEETLRHVRESHNELIYEGFKSLSKGYIEAFERMAAEKGKDIHSLHREGRNYSGILRIAQENDVDLIIMGAYGLGYINDEALGSTTTRVLRMANCDMLIARRSFSSGGILTGVDGSTKSQDALQRAVAPQDRAPLRWRCRAR